MSYANGTPFLNLAQTIGTDHRDWFDENEAKLDLDTKMKTLWDGAASTADILATLQEKVASLETDTTALETVVDNHGSSITTINESLVLINTALSTLNVQVTNKFDAAGVADPYDATHGIYAIGDVVTYNGQRYVCTSAVTAAEPFDVSKWNAEDVQTELDQINSVLEDSTSGDLTLEPGFSFASGGSATFYKRNNRCTLSLNGIIAANAGSNQLLVDSIDVAKIQTYASTINYSGAANGALYTSGGHLYVNLPAAGTFYGSITFEC